MERKKGKGEEERRKNITRCTSRPHPVPVGVSQYVLEVGRTNVCTREGGGRLDTLMAVVEKLCVFEAWPHRTRKVGEPNLGEDR